MIISIFKNKMELDHHHSLEKMVHERNLEVMKVTKKNDILSTFAL